MIKIKTFFFRTLIISSLIVLSSCVDLVNEITINANKSGTVFIGIESKALTFLSTLNSSSIIDLSQQDKLNTMPDEFMSKLKSIDGISNIQKVSDDRFGIKFDFKDQKSLNNAYYALADVQKKSFYPNLVKIKKHKIKVRNLTPYLNQYLKKNPNEEAESFFKYVTYKTKIITTSTIKASSIKKGFLATANKYEYTIPLIDMREKKENSGVKIKY